MTIILDPKRFSELPVTSSLDGTEIVPIVKNGDNDAVTIETIRDISGYVLGFGLNSITVGNTEPPSPEVGDIWVDTN